MGRRGRSKKIERPARRRKRFKITPRFPLIVLLTFGLLTLAIVWGLPKYQKIRDLSYQISVLEERKQAMEAERQRLLQEAEWLETHAAVEKIAREELGLVKPGERPLMEVEGAF